MNKQYKNINAITRVDKIAEEILSLKKNNCYRDNFFPMLINKLDYKIIAEIGVDKGEFSKHLLDKSNIDKIYCIDSWMDDFGSEYRPKEYAYDGGSRMQVALQHLKAYSSKTVFLKNNSLDAAKNIQDSSLDFCYIDGDHSLEGIYTDVYTWIHKVKVGGILAGHDYKDGENSGIKDYFGNQLPYRVKTVVDNFTNQYGFKLNYVGGVIKSWWFLKTF